MWIFYQHDICPEYHAIAARSIYNRAYPDHWNGRSGVRTWPACAPDLTPLSFFSWQLEKALCTRMFLLHREICGNVLLMNVLL
jgi:hypothetical protein